MAFWDDFLNDSDSQKKIKKFNSRAEAIDLEPLKSIKKYDSQEIKSEKKPHEKISPEIERLDEQPKKLKIGSTDLDLLSKNLERTAGFDISNINITQDDLWLLYRLKFGKGTRNKRSVLLPQFTEAFKKNLAKLKK